MVTTFSNQFLRLIYVIQASPRRCIIRERMLHVLRVHVSVHVRVSLVT